MIEVRGEKIKRRGITELLNPVRLGLAACLHGWLKTKPEISAFSTNFMR